MIDAVTDDTLFGGQLRLRQPLKGHRAGTDAVLLAASCPPHAATVCDLGAGAGTVGLRVAQMQPQAAVDLVECDAGMLALAAHNIAANGLDGRVQPVLADVLARPYPATLLARHKADVVLTNPPFAQAGQGRPSPVARKAAAHVLAGPLDGWLKAALRLLAPHGQLVMIHRADALPRLLAGLERRFGGITVKSVHPRADVAASRVLVRATLGSRAPFLILPPLVLHTAAGAFTAEAEAIHAGTASVDWR